MSATHESPPTPPSDARHEGRVLRVGDAVVRPQVAEGDLCSLGEVAVAGVPLRAAATRFLPWFDTYEGDVFRRFRLAGIDTTDGVTVIRTRAVSDPDMMFRERRDSSGDPCFREVSWDAPPLEAELRVCFAPARASVDGRAFTGLRYWFEYDGPNVPIHRLIDRQTWELGGHLDGNTLLLRNWLTPPRVRLSRVEAYTTVGLTKFAGLLPGNLWGRWTLLPSFDMQYGPAGVMLGWFDQVSLIRTVVETGPDEDALRHIDLHAFAQATSVRTNPKSILWCPDVLDDVDAMNLWTVVQDLEREKACRQLNIPAPPPQDLVLTEDRWVDVKYDSSYEHAVEVAQTFGIDCVFIDSVWENEQTMRDSLGDEIPAERRKGRMLGEYFFESQCATLDFRVAERPGGESGLKALCDRARGRGVKLISWLAMHLSSDSPLCHGRPDLGHGANGVFAAKESGRHPDTGYASGCWPINLNAPIAGYVREQVLGVCERTGLGGFLWDSFCNLGWWHVDYSDGSMRPQFDKTADLYAALTLAGLRLYPEALVTFTNASMCGLHGGNVYEGDQLGFSYHTCISLLWAGLAPGEYWEHRIVRGQEPIDLLFRCLAHGRVPLMTLQKVPREQWDAAAVEQLRELFRVYRTVRDTMTRRTVLKQDRGVLWRAEEDKALLFTFRSQPNPGGAVRVRDGVAVNHPMLDAFEVYRLSTTETTSLHEPLSL